MAAIIILGTKNNKILERAKGKVVELKGDYLHITLLALNSKFINKLLTLAAAFSSSRKIHFEHYCAPI